MTGHDNELRQPGDVIIEGPDYYGTVAIDPPITMSDALDKLEDAWENASGDVSVVYNATPLLIAIARNAQAFADNYGSDPTRSSVLMGHLKASLEQLLKALPDGCVTAYTINRESPEA